ncbi:MarR family winged helix-turn-helix transcriptional regulator [Aurantiacibacter zhengii]|uniref:MarR family transcriptional regulator n=1 Tax=Aurantiacibacter zhengii TaxID=2307003 RepID=A0A418NVD7_9SPHN|nr:MarR family transcriptional regulator [Aurantiacibacter zhengii]RIV87978.1 MarR family transcriptional regulator [Aurantiacibacter zhengii]
MKASNGGKISARGKEMVTSEGAATRPVKHDPHPRLYQFSPEHSLPHAFSVIANRVSHMLQGMYGELFGITVADWRIIAILGSNHPLSAKALAELTAMDQVSVSRAIDHLTNQKLVLRDIDHTDRRRVALRLSRRGQEIFDKVMPLLHACENRLIDELSEADAVTLRRIMGLLVDRSARLFSDNTDWRPILNDDQL